LYKDKYTIDNLQNIGLSERQIKAVQYLKENQFISNSEYMILTNVSDRTSLRDLEDLVEKGILQKTGEKKGTKYLLVNSG